MATANKYLISDQSALLKKKLELLSTNLQSSLSAGKYETQQQYLFEAVRVLNSFYKGLNDPLFDDEEIKADTSSNSICCRTT